MSEKTIPGCGLWIILSITSGILALFVGDYTSIPTSLATIPPAPNPVLEVTVVPQETSAPFVLENNQITYAYTPTLGKPCYYEIAGHVLDLQGMPFTDFVVNIKMLDENAPERPGYAIPGQGFAEGGPSGWATVLPASPLSYEIWLTTEIGGDELSPHVVVPPQQCSHNQAIVNFVQVRSLP
jgi:hypothetical protein